MKRGLGIFFVLSLFLAVLLIPLALSPPTAQGSPVEQNISAIIPIDSAGYGLVDPGGGFYAIAVAPAAYNIYSNALAPGRTVLKCPFNAAGTKGMLI